MERYLRGPSDKMQAMIKKIKFILEAMGSY